MVGRKDLPQTRLQDIVAAAKANPGSIIGGDRGRRHRAASGGRRLHEGSGREAAGSALQGLAAGVHRSARGPHRSVLRFDCGGPALRAIGAGEGHRRAVVEAQPARARCADDVGGWRARSRCRFLARNLRTRQNPAGGHRKAAQGYPRFAARPQGTLREERRRSVGSAGRTGSMASSCPNTRTGRN